MSADEKGPDEYRRAIRPGNLKPEYARRPRRPAGARTWRLGPLLARRLRRPPDEAVVLELLAWLLLLLLLAVTVRHL